MEIGMWTGSSSQELHSSLNWPPYTKKMSSKVNVARAEPAELRAPQLVRPQEAGSRPVLPARPPAPEAEPPVGDVRHGASSPHTAPTGFPLPPCTRAAWVGGRPDSPHVASTHCPFTPHPTCSPGVPASSTRLLCPFAVTEGPVTDAPGNVPSSFLRPCGQPRSQPCPHPRPPAVWDAAAFVLPQSRLRTAGLARGLPHRWCRMLGSGPPEHRFPAWAQPPGGSDAPPPGLRGPRHRVASGSPSPLPASLLILGF